VHILILVAGSSFVFWQLSRTALKPVADPCARAGSAAIRAAKNAAATSEFFRVTVPFRPRDCLDQILRQ